MSNGVAFVRYNAGECVDPYGPYDIGREVVVKLVEAPPSRSPGEGLLPDMWRAAPPDDR